jgi:hypothetical protein
MLNKINFSVVLFTLLTTLFVSYDLMGQLPSNVILAKPIHTDDLAKVVDISYEVYPFNLQYGDCYFVSFCVKNISDQEVVLAPNDLFVVDTIDVKTFSRIKVKGLPICTLEQPNTDWAGTFDINLMLGNMGKIIIVPKEKKIVHVDRYLAFANNEDKPAWLSQSIEVHIKYFAPEFAKKIQHPLPIINISPRINKDEITFIKRGYPILGQYHFPELIRTSIGLLQLPDIFRVGNPLHFGLPTWKDWKTKEDSFSEGTFRDEMTLSRIILQYIDTHDPLVLKELQEWFDTLHDVQRISYSRTFRSLLFRDITPWLIGKGREEEISKAKLQFQQRIFELYQTIKKYDILPKNDEEQKKLNEMTNPDKK